MFDKLKDLFSKKTKKEATAPKAERAKRERKFTDDDAAKMRQLAKEAATAKGEPWVAIIHVDIDPDNINTGAFELDWNVPFLKKLIRAGYHQNENDTDEIMVDRWFQTVCRNIALEVYEQQMADPSNRGDADVRPTPVRKPLGGGRSEIS
jgi:hypothetical protein